MPYQRVVDVYDWYVYDSADVLVDLRADSTVATTYLNAPGNGHFRREIRDTTGDLAADAYGQFIAYAIWRSCKEICDQMSRLLKFSIPLVAVLNFGTWFLIKGAPGR